MSIRMIATLACCCGLLAGGCTDSGPPPAASVGAAHDDSDAGVVLLRYKAGSESTEQRERGFLETMQKEFPDIKVISSDQHAGLTSLKSKEMAIQLVNKYGDRMQGLFVVCEPNAAGALQRSRKRESATTSCWLASIPTSGWSRRCATARWRASCCKTR